MSTKAYREHRYETFNETCPRVVSKTIHFKNKTRKAGAEKFEVGGKKRPLG